MGTYYPELLQWVDNKFPQLSNPFYKITTKLNWIYHNRTDFPACRVCGKQFGIFKNMKKITSDYSRWCSYNHMAVDPEIVAKREATNEQRYGSKNVFSSDYGKKKIKNTMTEKYGGIGLGSQIIR